MVLIRLDSFWIVHKLLSGNNLCHQFGEEVEGIAQFCSILRCKEVKGA